MSATNRVTKFNKLHRVAKKHYQVVKPPSGRTVLEHLLFACCLQNSNFEDAEEAMARIQQTYFDWNEVRVTTAKELAEVMSCLPESIKAATRLKKTLNSVFETHYAYDIDFLRKENLGKAIQKLDKGRGVTPFILSYVAQNALGGHQIAVDESMLLLMYVIGAIDEKEKKSGKIPGLERAISKTKGVDFFSTVHQLAVAFYNNKFKPDLRKILLSIDASAKDRFPKRASKKKVVVKPAKKKKAAQPAEPASKVTKKKTTKKAATKTAKPAKAAKTTTKKKATKKKATKKKAGQPKKTKATRSSSTKRLKKKKPR